MNERALHNMLVKLRELKAWHLGLIFVVLLLMSAYLLRQNNLHMITLRNEVAQADEQNKNIPLALTNLRDYIAAHMNTGMGENGIYLEHSYERAYTAAIQQAAQGNSASAIIYQNADKTCQTSSTEAFLIYTQCITDKLIASGVAKDPGASAQTPSADLYRFNYVSPVWSPDAAGFMVLATMLTGVLLVGRALLQGVVYLFYQANR